ncbi:hypothetical protein AM571_CH01829 [Rhizobium etli 8C-3]|uniref:Tlde1 domain-containing protein n=1 Tax=Rhizobium etli 8C-3 TaxID=538025 RepID=A0A1L5P3B7_RHIET|nr:DUF2778 domain-containing protein [Rhizobium etli]APO74649.1 hypothetical protein AM571_CH01829 [Rhizobium etli 8C-3]
MAFAVETREGVNPFGWAFFRSTRPLRLISGTAAIGIAVALSAWTIASIAAMHTSAMPQPTAVATIADVAIARTPVPHVPAHQVIRIKKFSRLPGQTTVSDRMVGELSPKSSKDIVALMQRRGLSLLAMRNNSAAMAAALKQQALVLASAAPVSPVTAPAALPAPDYPLQTALAKPVAPALGLALAASFPSAKPIPTAAPVELASAETTTSDEPFGLVLAPGTDIPLPMARPGKPKIDAPEAGPALAYARTEDDDEEMPAFAKPALMPSARNGVAIYDIEASIVYLPNGERLEAHSGLGAMRDKPRFADKKMRGPTPPHTYDLAMREALFHGVEAIRLHPIGGPQKIHGRVGLLAHTYMLGKRGDSNGCISFKDYRRFLAAFKRGEVKRLVVVPRLKNPPSPRPSLASLFSKRS